MKVLEKENVSVEDLSSIQNYGYTCAQDSRGILNSFDNQLELILSIRKKIYINKQEEIKAGKREHKLNEESIKSDKESANKTLEDKIINAKSRIKNIEENIIPGLKTECETKKAAKDNDKDTINKIKDELKNSLIEIDEHPERYDCEKPTKMTFFIKSFLTLTITIYLWLFYSATIFSAFLREFNENDTEIITNLFDPTTIGAAFNQGVSAVAFIIFAPFIFLGFGYALFAVKQWYWKVLVFMAALFFDCLLAMQIAYKIHELTNISTEESAYRSFNIFDYLFHSDMALSFWLLIFSGCFVYLLWGAMYKWFDMDYQKYNIVNQKKQAINSKIDIEDEKTRKLNEDIEKINMDYQNKIDIEKNKIIEENKVIDKYENDITVNKEIIRNSDNKIKQYKDALEEKIVVPMEKEIYRSFYSGWINWLSKNDLDGTTDSIKKNLENFLERHKSDVGIDLME